MINPETLWKFLSPLKARTSFFESEEDQHYHTEYGSVQFLYLRKYNFYIMKITEKANRTARYEYCYDSRVGEIQFERGLYNIALSFPTGEEFTQFLHSEFFTTFSKEIRGLPSSMYSVSREADLTPSQLSVCIDFIRYYNLRPYATLPSSSS